MIEWNFISRRSSATNILEPDGQVPAVKQTLEEIEQSTAFALACSTQKTSQIQDTINIGNLQKTMKVCINIIFDYCYFECLLEKEQQKTNKQTNQPDSTSYFI